MVSDKHYYEEAPPRRNRLMLIGIDKYEQWNPLAYPVSDCEAFFEVLQKHYGFTREDLLHIQGKPLYDGDATWDLIYEELSYPLEKDEFGNTRIGADDNLIIYFAGHGYLDETLDEGYWIPVDAPALIKDTQGKPRLQRRSDVKKFLSVSELVKILSSIHAHHIVLIVDACFPQAFARMAVDVPPSGNAKNREDKPSRWILTSGGMEKVLDKSPFAKALRDVLEKVDEKNISIKWIGAEVEKRVSNTGLQSPWVAPLTENRYDGGVFSFCRRSPVSQADAAPAIGAIAAPQRMREGSRHYLERLKSGRFKYLRIEKVLLSETDLPPFVDVSVKVNETHTPLHQALESIWGQSQPHAVVLGVGGMGKTVSLLQLWQDLLEENTTTVPVFVALNEYNAASDEKKTDFVLRSIARNCGLAEDLTVEWKNALWELIRTPPPHGQPPALVLLLDGFNEVTAQHTALLIELNRLAGEAKGIQMVITSRHVEIRNFRWAQQTETIELLPLSDAQMENYLHALRRTLPTDPALRAVLGNPMMLTLYAGTSEIAERNKTDKRFRFLPNTSVGELLWNFTEAQLVKYYTDHAHDSDEQAWYHFLLRLLLPYLAYRMEAQGDFFIASHRRTNPDFNFKSVLEEAFVDLDFPTLTEVFPLFEGRRKQLGFIEIADRDASEQRTRRVRDYLVHQLHLLVQEGDELRFLHQNFRDFFAACHLLNVVDWNAPNPAWTSRGLPVYLRKMLGEIEGQHHYDPRKVLNGEPQPGFQAESRLTALLDRYRGVFHEEEAQTLVMNVVRTLADGRKTLAGADMRRLDLQKVYLNGLWLSENMGGYRYLPAQLEGALLVGKQLFAQGHSDSVRSVSYSPDGKKILTGSDDGTAKEWSVETGACLQTFEGHSDAVTSVCYSPDGKKVLTGSRDKTAKAWSVETGECLQTFKRHSSYVTSVCYSPDGKNILTGSEDATAKEWSVETGACLQTFEGHSDCVNSVCYSLDGKKVLTGSENATAKAWSVETGACLQTFEGHSRFVTSVCYSPDGKNILTGSIDETVKAWSVETGACLRTFEGHSDFVLSVCYSPDGKNILTGSYDNTSKVWSVETGECLQTLQNIPGLRIWQCDFSQLHPDSAFTEEEKEQLRQYGAIFHAADRHRWEEAITEARKILNSETES
ncbi:MAG: caspase family protein [Saprospiraceae bacterium]